MYINLLQKLKQIRKITGQLCVGFIKNRRQRSNMRFDLTPICMSAKDRKRGLFLPEFPSEDLAEFFGILTGDGYINYYEFQNKYLLEIAGDSHLDYEYLRKYVNDLIKNIFNLDSSFFKRKDQNAL